MASIISIDDDDTASTSSDIEIIDLTGSSDNDDTFDLTTSSSDIEIIDLTADSPEDKIIDLTDSFDPPFPTVSYNNEDIYPQLFSLPKPIIRYITMTPTSAKAWAKLITTCKYFFNQNPILPIRRCSKCYTVAQKWSISWKPDEYKIMALSDIPCKIWLYGFLEFRNLQYYFNIFSSPEKSFHPSYYSSQLSSKIFRYDLEELHISSQGLSLKEYELLTGSKTIKRLNFHNVYVKYPDDNFVPLDILIKNLPNASKIMFDNEWLQLGPNTVQKMVELLAGFENLEVFCIGNIPRTFDFQTFTNFVKVSSRIQFLIQVRYPASKVFKRKVKNMKAELSGKPNLFVAKVYYFY